tara:strand:- start:2789 stop:3331 length:543 start_codon:yes stop_codon:yes gene_type:complete
LKKLLFTFFFGYASYKYRRLIRTPIILIALGTFIGLNILFRNFDILFGEPNHFRWNRFGTTLAITISGFTVIGFISYLIEPFVIEKNNEILESKTTVQSIPKEVPQVPQGSKSNSSNNGIRKFKFLLVYFVIFWLQATVVVVISLTVIGPRPSGLIAFGGLLSFWTSYKITKYLFSKSKP